jgi:putative tryptophan/tyrosine transport system substrate-binding protein
MRNRDRLLAVAGLAALLGQSACGGKPQGAAVPSVGIFYYTDDVRLDQLVQGVKDALREEGFDSTRARIEVRSAQGDMATIQAIATKYAAEMDLIIPMTTPCLVAAARAVRGTSRRVVFAGTYNPYVAGVAKSATDHPANLTGVTGPPPFGDFVALIASTIPGRTRIGMIYNPGEANAVFSRERMLAETTKRGLTLVDRTVSSAGEVQQVAQSLAGKVDAFAVIGDNTVYSAVESIVTAANRARIPVISAEPNQARRGVAVAFGPDYYQMGHTAGLVAARVLRGESPAGIPITESVASRLVVNPGAAERQGAAITDSLLKHATEVIR